MEKLVRDKIPELTGRKDYRVAEGPEEFKHFLFKKLREEVEELIKEPSIEELADVRTVLAFILTFVLECTETELEKEIWDKGWSKGFFHSKIVMDFPKITPGAIIERVIQKNPISCSIQMHLF